LFEEALEGEKEWVRGAVVRISDACMQLNQVPNPFAHEEYIVGTPAISTFIP
jgi:hypothetical protein